MLFTKRYTRKIWATILIAFVLATLFMYQPVFAKRIVDESYSNDDPIIEKNIYLSYTVSKGDTLWRISQNHGVTVADIQNANNMNGDLIIVGQSLKIPQTVVINYEERRVLSTTNRQVGSGVQTNTIAVKEKKVANVVKDDRYWLAKIIEAEAGIEPIEGKIAVGAVVLNRVEEEWFPDTIQEVIFQKLNGVYQFSPVGNGRMDIIEPTEESYEAADRALAGEDPTDGALFFYNPKISKSTFFKKKEFLARIGNHQFFQ